MVKKDDAAHGESQSRGEEEEEEEEEAYQNAPHWTHAGTIAERRKALDALRTNRQFSREVAAHRWGEQVQNMTSEQNRLSEIRNLQRPAMQFYARRRAGLGRDIARMQTDIDHIRGTPNLLR